MHARWDLRWSVSREVSHFKTLQDAIQLMIYHQTRNWRHKCSSVRDRGHMQDVNYWLEWERDDKWSQAWENRNYRFGHLTWREEDLLIYRYFWDPDIWDTSSCPNHLPHGYFEKLSNSAVNADRLFEQSALCLLLWLDNKMLLDWHILRRVHGWGCLLWSSRAHRGKALFNFLQ